MARERSTDRPRTRWTDGNGRLSDEFSSVWHRNWLAEFSRAGLSPKALHPSGCELPVMSPEWDIATQGTGCITDLLYTISRLNRGLNDAGDPHRDNALDVLAVMDRFLAIGDYLQLDERFRSVVARLCHEVIEWRRMLYYLPNGLPLPDTELESAYTAADTASESAISYDVEVDAMEMPEALRAEGHQAHGHARSPFGWSCLAED